MTTFTRLIDNRTFQIFTLLIVSASLYLPAMGFSFVWDDRALIAENWYIRSLGSIPGFFLSEFRVDPTAATGFYRPVVMVTYALDHALWGDNPAGFHLSNIIFNTMTVLFVFLAVRELLCGTDYPSAIPWATALIFAVHPVHVESVAFISGRTDILATLFSLMSLWAYLRSRAETVAPRKRALYGLSLVFFLLGLFSKEITVALLIILPLCEYYLFPRTSRDARGRRWAVLLPFLAVFFVYLAFRVSAVPPATTLGHFGTGFEERVHLALAAVTRYVQISFVPLDMKTYYMITLYRPTHLFFWLHMGLLTSLAAGVVILWRKAPTAAFCAMWFIVTLFPSLKIFPFPGSDMADRYLYLPSVATSLITAIALNRLGRVGLPAAAGTVALVLLVLAVTRTGYWKDDGTLFTRMAEEEPRSVIAHSNLGRVYSEAGDTERGFSGYYKAIELDRQFSGQIISRAAIRLNVGLAAHQRGLYEDAVREYQTALLEDPNHIKVHYNLAMVYEDLGRYTEAEHEYREAIRLFPPYSEAHNNLGVLYARMGRPDDAARHHKEAIRYYPGNFEAHYSLAALLEKTGDTAGAIEHYRFFVENAPPRYADHMDKVRGRLAAMGEK